MCSTLIWALNYIYIITHTCIFFTHIHTRHKCIHTYIHKYIHTYTRIHTQIHTHTHAHIHIYLRCIQKAGRVNAAARSTPHTRSSAVLRRAVSAGGELEGNGDNPIVTLSSRPPKSPAYQNSNSFTRRWIDGPDGLSASLNPSDDVGHIRVYETTQSSVHSSAYDTGAGCSSSHTPLTGNSDGPVAVTTSPKTPKRQDSTCSDGSELGLWARRVSEEGEAVGAGYAEPTGALEFDPLSASFAAIAAQRHADPNGDDHVRGVIGFGVPSVVVAATMTVGCGDSFLAGFAVRFASGGSLGDSLREGSACGGANALGSRPGHVDPKVVGKIFSTIKSTRIY
eukprot:Opistho-2@42198